MFTKKKTMIGAALLLCGLIYGIYHWSTGGVGSAKAEYYEVKSGNLHVSVTEGGTLQAVNEEVVKNHLSGNSRIVFIVPEGSSVKKGDVLVELDAAEMKEQKKKLEIEIESSKASVVAAKNSHIIEQSTVDSEVRAAKKAITFAQMDLDKFKKLDKQQQIRNAATDIDNAEDAYKLSEERYEWSQKLAKKGFETKSQVDRDRLDLSSKTKSLETAKSRQKMLKLYDLPKQEAELESKLAEAKKKFIRVEKQGESKLSRSLAEKLSKDNKLKLNQERLVEVIDKLSKTKLFAPVDGLVLYPQSSRNSRNAPIEEGAMVGRNRALVNIPDTSVMKVRISVPEFHINKVKMGQSAFVTIDSIPNQRFKAKVSTVAPVPESQGWFSTGDKSYRVEVLITGDLPDVKPSISAKAEITIKDLSDVLTVPIQALQAEKGKTFCYVKRSGEDEKVEVEIGLLNNTFVEIKSGLKEGDQVRLSNPED